MCLCFYERLFPDDRQQDAHITARSHKNALTLMNGPFHLQVCSDVPASVSGSLLPVL